MKKTQENQRFSVPRNFNKISRETKQKILIWAAIIITAINFLLVIAFLVYLYFWIERVR